MQGRGPGTWTQWGGGTGAVRRKRGHRRRDRGTGVGVPRCGAEGCGTDVGGGRGHNEVLNPKRGNKPLNKPLRSHGRGRGGSGGMKRKQNPYPFARVGVGHEKPLSRVCTEERQQQA